jgi:hypothetical protein
LLEPQPLHPTTQATLKTNKPDRTRKALQNPGRILRSYAFPMRKPPHSAV